MNEILKITNPEEYIATVSLSEAMKSLDNIVTSYKEYKIADAMETTKRIAIRENAKIQIAALEEATKRELKKIDDAYSVSMRLIEELNKVLQEHDVLDERTENICLCIINSITKW